MMSDKLYYRLLIFFVAILGVAQMGWGIYFLTPRKPERRAEMRYLAFRRISSPTFKYRFQVESAAGTDWQEKEIELDQGQRILDLLHGSKSTTLAMDEYRRQHPELANALISPEIGHLVGSLTVFEHESDTPSLTIDFLNIQNVDISAAGRESQTFVISGDRLKELDTITADIKWGPIPKDEP